jgi:predicted nucleic acid-binding protein
MVFLDTDVLVDCLRGLPSAQEWMARSSSEEFQIPGIVAMELITGCQNRTELERTHRFLNAFDVTWPEASEFAEAYALLSEHHLASNLGIPDCLIASMAILRSARLYTFNLRHFGVIQGLDVQSPYTR